MIVRILGEGQLEVADDAARAAQRSSTAPSSRPSRPATTTAFAAALAALLDGVRTRPARRSPDDSLEDSDLILPPADATHRRGPRAAQRRRTDPRLTP